MRVLFVDCEVRYTGRGDTKLARGTRMLLEKADGSVSIHKDEKVKPLNYMGGGQHSVTHNDDGTQTWVYETNKEVLTLTIYNILTETRSDLPPDPHELERDGTEPQLQEWLAEHPETFGEGWKFLEREFETGAGPVDLLFLTPEGKYAVTEVKRVVTRSAGFQLKRYMNGLEENPDFAGNMIGVLVGVDVRNSAVQIAEKHDFMHVKVPEDWKTTEQ